MLLAGVQYSSLNYKFKSDIILSQIDSMEFPYMIISEDENSSGISDVRTMINESTNVESTVLILIYDWHNDNSISSTEFFWKTVLMEQRIFEDESNILSVYIYFTNDNKPKG